jgi:hypothetical protein
MLRQGQCFPENGISSLTAPCSQAADFIAFPIFDVIKWRREKALNENFLAERFSQMKITANICFIFENVDVLPGGRMREDRSRVCRFRANRPGRTSGSSAISAFRVAGRPYGFQNRRLWAEMSVIKQMDGARDRNRTGTPPLG